MSAVLGVNAYNGYGVPGVFNLGRFQYTGQVWLAEAQLCHSEVWQVASRLGPNNALATPAAFSAISGCEYACRPGWRDVGGRIFRISGAGGCSICLRQG